MVFTTILKAYNKRWIAVTLKNLMKIIVALNVKKRFVLIGTICMTPRKKEGVDIVMKIALKYALLL